MFLAQRHASTDKGEPLYQMQDTHWTTRGLELAAALVGKRIKRYDWYKGLFAHRRVFKTKDEPFTRHGDLVSHLPEGERANFVPETLVGHQVVNADGSLYEDVWPPDATASHHFAARFSGTAQVKMILQELPQKFAPVLFKQPLQISVRHPQHSRSSQPRGEVIKYLLGICEGLLFRGRMCFHLHRGASRVVYLFRQPMGALYGPSFSSSSYVLASFCCRAEDLHPFPDQHALIVFLSMPKPQFLAVVAILVVGACSSDSRDVCDHISLDDRASIQIDKCSQTGQHYYSVTYDAYKRPTGFMWDITCADGVTYHGLVSDIAYSNGAISSAEIIVLSCDGSSYSCETGELSGGICTQ